MKVGDLVRYKDEKWQHWVGIVIREIPGTQEVRVVKWTAPKEMVSSNPKNQMEVISESR
jgi:hypothetical protein